MLPLKGSLVKKDHEGKKKKVLGYIQPRQPVTFLDEWSLSPTILSLSPRPAQSFQLGLPNQASAIPPLHTSTALFPITMLAMVQHLVLPMLGDMLWAKYTRSAPFKLPNAPGGKKRGWRGQRLDPDPFSSGGEIPRGCEGTRSLSRLERYLCLVLAGMTGCWRVWRMNQVWRLSRGWLNSVLGSPSLFYHQQWKHGVLAVAF